MSENYITTKQILQAESILSNLKNLMLIPHDFTSALISMNLRTLNNVTANLDDAKRVRLAQRIADLPTTTEDARFSISNYLDTLQAPNENIDYQKLIDAPQYDFEQVMIYLTAQKREEYEADYCENNTANSTDFAAKIVQEYLL